MKKIPVYTDTKPRKNKMQELLAQVLGEPSEKSNLMGETLIERSATDGPLHPADLFTIADRNIAL
jgi:hypothetical protein